MTFDVNAAVELYTNFAQYNAVSSGREYALSQEEEKAESVFSQIDDLLSQDGISDEKKEKLGELRKQQEEVLEQSYSVYNNAMEKLGDFNFMNGKDPKNDDDYFDQLQSLVFGQMLTGDTDGNFAFSLDEWTNQGANELKGHIPDEAIQGLIDNGDVKEEFNVLDYDGNGEIGYEELMTLYWLADMLGEDGEYENGKFNSGDYAEAYLAYADAKNGDADAKALVEDLIGCFI